MRIWTVHPKFLDQKGLGAAWREGLLAQKCLDQLSKGIKIGYSNHSQLIRFKQHKKPLQMLCNYLHLIVDEACNRKYNFNRDLILKNKSHDTMTETVGQLKYEWNWLMSKLQKRNPDRFQAMKFVDHIEASPMFFVVDGARQEWEK